MPAGPLLHRRQVLVTGQSGAWAACAARQLCACRHVSTSSPGTSIHFWVLVFFFFWGEAGGNDRGKCASSAGRVPGKEQALRTCWSSPPAPRRPDHPSERRLWPQSVPGFRVGEKPCYKFASEPGAGCLLLTAVVPFPRPVETGLEFSGDGGGGSGGCCALGSPSGKGGGHCPSCF